MPACDPAQYVHLLGVSQPGLAGQFLNSVGYHFKQGVGADVLVVINIRFQLDAVGSRRPAAL